MSAPWSSTACWALLVVIGGPSAGGGWPGTVYTARSPPPQEESMRAAAIGAMVAEERRTAPRYPVPRRAHTGTLSTRPAAVGGRTGLGCDAEHVGHRRARLRATVEQRDTPADHRPLVADRDRVHHLVVRDRRPGKAAAAACGPL